MTLEEFRDYVEFLRLQDEISYDVYSGLIDGIDTLEQEPILDKIRAEKYIKSKMCNDCSVYLGGGKCSDNCKVIEAINSLKQEPVLDKIITDIEEIQTYDGLYIDRSYVLQILDKYKAESVDR